MAVTFEDIVEARAQALRDGKTPVTTRLTEDSFEGLKGDTKAVTTDEDEFVPDGEEVVGRLNALDVVEGDENVLVTEDGTEYPVES